MITGVDGHGVARTDGTKEEVYDIPAKMKAIRYNKVKDWSLVTMPVPVPKAHEILVKGRRNLDDLSCAH